MSYWGIGIGVVCGVVGAYVGGPAGASAGFALGNAGGSMIDGKNQKEEIEGKQKEATDTTNKMNETAARRQARGMYNQSMRQNTSSQVFTAASMEAEKDTDYADIRDKGQPFHAVDKKPMYGNPTVVKAA